MTLTKGHARNAAVTPLDHRLQDMAQHVCNADGSPRTGVLGAASGGTIVATTATMNVTVQAAEFLGSKGKSDGVMIFTNDGVANVLISAAPVSNSRIDVIWTKQNDDTTGDANALPVFGVTAGVALASPTKPAIPTGAVELATLRIYSGTTATNGGSNTLANTFQMTASRGGLVPFRTKTEIDAWTTAVIGQQALDLATGSIYVWSASSTWLPTAFAAGVLMRRTASAGAVAATYTDLSANTFWAESNRLGFPAYNNGVTVPYTGVYRVTYTVATTTTPCLAGVTVNKSSSIVIGDLEAGSASGVAAGVAVATASVEVKLNANDVLRLFAISNSGSATWRTEAGLGIFQVEYLRAA